MRDPLDAERWLVARNERRLAAITRAEGMCEELRRLDREEGGLCDQLKPSSWWTIALMGLYVVAIIVGGAWGLTFGLRGLVRWMVHG